VPERAPDEVGVSVLILDKMFPAEARFEYGAIDMRRDISGYGKSPTAVSYFLPLQHLRRSIKRALVELVIRDQNTDSIVHKDHDFYDHNTTGDLLDFSLPQLPAGDYWVELKIAIDYFTGDGYEREDNQVFLEFTSTSDRPASQH